MYLPSTLSEINCCEDTTGSIAHEDCKAVAKHFKPRSHSRIPVSCFLYYLGEGVVGTGKVCDLSVKGWRIEGDKPVSVGMRLTLRVFLPDEPKAIDIEGVIVQWVKDGAFGLENVGVNAVSEARIKKFVDSMLKPPGSSRVA